MPAKQKRTPSAEEFSDLSCFLPSSFYEIPDFLDSISFDGYFLFQPRSGYAVHLYRRDQVRLELPTHGPPYGDRYRDHQDRRYHWMNQHSICNGINPTLSIYAWTTSPQISGIYISNNVFRKNAIPKATRTSSYFKWQRVNDGRFFREKIPSNRICKFCIEFYDPNKSIQLQLFK